MSNTAALSDPAVPQPEEASFEERRRRHAPRAPSTSASTSSRSTTPFAPEARRHVVQGYPWPGNLRELEAFVRRLPSAAAPASIDLDAALAALREGALDQSTVTRARRPDDASAWGAVTARADRVWELKCGPAAPARAQEFREYVEEVMKPLFFARALGLEDLGAVPERPATSYEEMGRRMGCDASTVKNQLGRYLELERLLDAAKT